MNYIMLSEISRIHACNCGIAILNPGWIHPERILSSSVLIIGKKSTVEISEEDTNLIVKPGSVIILSAGRRHKGTKPIKIPSSYFWMHFETERAPLLLSEKDALTILKDEQRMHATLEDSILLPQQMNLKEPKYFLDLFHDLLYEQERPSFTCQKMQLLFKLLLINLNEIVISSVHDQKYDFTRYNVVYIAIQRIHENLTDRNFSVKILSDLLNYNPDYLGRIFKERMGKSISDYIIDQRIKYAVGLLVESNNTIESIAYDSGFNSTRNFIRQFENRKCETPSELRRRHRIMHVTSV